jgi:hypothetical protein
LQGASDFKLLDRKVVDAWCQMGERNTFFRGMVLWLGYKRIEIPFTVQQRIAGRSRWSILSLTRLAVVALLSFSALPLQVVTFLGILQLVGSLGFGAYVIIVWVLGRALPGFATVILLELITGGLLMMSLGIIGTYIAQIYDEVKHRPRYVITAEVNYHPETTR